MTLDLLDIINCLPSNSDMNDERDLIAEFLNPLWLKFEPPYLK
jgi:hypothetical protein